MVHDKAAKRACYPASHHVILGCSEGTAGCEVGQLVRNFGVHDLLAYGFHIRIDVDEKDVDVLGVIRILHGVEFIPWVLEPKRLTYILYVYARAARGKGRGMGLTSPSVLVRLGNKRIPLQVLLVNQVPCCHLLVFPCKALLYS